MEDIKFKLIPPFVKGMMATYMLTVITVLLSITCEDSFSPSEITPRSAPN